MHVKQQLLYLLNDRISLICAPHKKMHWFIVLMLDDYSGHRKYTIVQERRQNPQMMTAMTT